LIGADGNAIVDYHRLSVRKPRKPSLQPGQSYLRNTSDTIDLSEALLEKYPVKENVRKAKIVGLVIGVEIMQRNNYRTSQSVPPDRCRK
jgi:hypothetical protein